ncbi:hypothetical protein TcCL_NonESM10202 [Trypanosoma cruzi]|nr:hypothetical protein TcCL_NonESM10202 [Trypanosoma cruzi]
MRSVPLFAAVGVPCAWLLLAVRRGWRCFCVRSAAGFSSPFLCPFVCGKVVGEDMCRGSDCGWLPASPRALRTSIHVALLDGVSQHPECGEEVDGEDLLWAEGG